MTGAGEISTWSLIAIAAIAGLNGALSVALSLGVERSLAIAAARMTAQLALVGAALSWLFSNAAPGWTLAMGLVMALFAAREIAARQSRRFAGWWSHGLGGGAVALASVAVSAAGIGIAVGPDPWYAPEVAIPLFGMILGNAMTGVSLGLDALTNAAVRERAAIETRLALGASRYEALRPAMRDSMRRGFVPMINAMAASGVVFLPGMMTGQILAGAPPETAVRYQLLIMFLISAATGLGLLLAVLGGAWRLTDERHRLRPERLRSEG